MHVCGEHCVMLGIVEKLLENATVSKFSAPPAGPLRPRGANMFETFFTLSHESAAPFRIRSLSIFARAIQSYRMNMTMCIIIRHHMVVGKASVCRESAETRHRNRNPLLPRRLCAGQTGALGEAESLTV